MFPSVEAARVRYEEVLRDHDALNVIIYDYDTREDVDDSSLAELHNALEQRRLAAAEMKAIKAWIHSQKTEGEWRLLARAYLWIEGETYGRPMGPQPEALEILQTIEKLVGPQFLAKARERALATPH